MPSIQQAKILIMSTNGFEQSELMTPLQQLREAGATVHVATPDGKDIRGWKEKNWGDTVKADVAINAVKADDYHAIVIPGGQINPDTLRLDQSAVKLVQQFIEGEQVVAAVCHGPIMLIEADAVRGKKVTSWPSIRKDLENAGATWSDKPVVTDHGLITSRKPEDLDAFVAKIIEEIEEIATAEQGN